MSGISASKTARPTRVPLDEAIIAALAAVGACALILTLGALALGGWRVSLAVLAGGAIATVNLWVFAHMGRGLLAAGGRARLWMLAGAVKFAALLAGVWLLIESGLVSGAGLAVGYVALPLGIALASLVGRSFRAEDTGPVEPAGAANADLVTPSRSDDPGDD